MRVFWILPSVLVLLASASQAAKLSNSVPYVPGEILVKPKSESLQHNVRTLQRQVQGDVIRSFSALGMELWRVDPSQNIFSTVVQLRESNAFEFVELNYLRRRLNTPNDLDPNQWAIQNTGTITVSGVTYTGTAGADMDLINAWNLTTGSAAVRVAVIDDSVDIDHPDLAANILGGYDAKNDDSDPSSDDASEFHGTNVAGCIGAVGNNATGIVGAAWNVSIIPIKFGLDTASELAAFEYAITSGAHIVNASYGSIVFTEAEYQAVARLKENGILLIASAGNSHSNSDDKPSYPASYDLPNILSVAASDYSDILTAWSQYGTTKVDVAAPGLDIYTTANDGTYTFTSGTSFSSPYTAGVAALVKSFYPSADYLELKARIIKGADQLASMQGYSASSGRVNATNAINAAPSPVIVISQIAYLDNNDNTPTPGESAELSLQLENVWQNATNVVATLSTGSANATITKSTANYSSIDAGKRAAPDLPFQIQIAAGIGHARIPFSVNIQTDEGYQVTRYFELEVGRLGIGSSVSTTIQTNNQDDVHRFRLTIPEGTDNITLELTSTDDLDILVKKNTYPVFLNGFGQGYLLLDNSYIALEEGADETLSVIGPEPGEYYVLVANYSQTANVNYTLTVSSDAGDTSTTHQFANYFENDTAPYQVGNGLPKSGSFSISFLCLLILLFALRTYSRKTNH